MKLHYDTATDSLYIDLAERPSVDSEEVADGIVLDSLPSTVETIAAA
jgi:uncharacterized protein YuzE